MTSFRSLFGAGYVNSFVNVFMEKIAFRFNHGFVPEGGKGREILEKRLEEEPVSSFPDSYRKGGWGVRSRSTLMAAWSEREGVSRTLQFERREDKDESEKVMSMMVEYLWLEKVGTVPELRMSAPTLIKSSSRVLPLGLSEVQPHRVLCALVSMEQR